MWVKILLLFFVFSFLFKPDFAFDQDLGRHLKLGEIIWQTKSVPNTNLFSYTNPNFPFINTHWLFEVGAYVISQAIGLQSLLIIKLAVFLISVLLILKTIPKNHSALLLPIGFLFLYVLRERTELRPEIFSFLFTAATLYILEKFTTSSRGAEGDVATFLGRLPQPLRGFAMTNLIFLLPLIQFLWVNTHIYFFVGLTLQAIFLIYLIYQSLRSHIVSSPREAGGKLKLLALIFALSVAVSLLNPSGITGFLYPLNVSKNYGYTIVENQSMFLLESINFQDPNFLFVKISLAIIVFSFIVAFIRKTATLKNSLVICFGAILALLNVRSFPYLVFLSLPATLQNFGSIKNSIFFKGLSFAFGAILLSQSYSNLISSPGLKFVERGQKALDFVINNNLPKPIYNNFDIGSYIIYRGFPKYTVFVDGRPEAYPQEFFSQVYIPTQADYTKFKSLEAQWYFQTIIFSVTDQTPWGRAFLTSVVNDKDWKTVYLDDFMIVLVKNSWILERNNPPHRL